MFCFINYVLKSNMLITSEMNICWKIYIIMNFFLSLNLCYIALVYILLRGVGPRRWLELQEKVSVPNIKSFCLDPIIFFIKRLVSLIYWMEFSIKVRNVCNEVMNECEVVRKTCTYLRQTLRRHFVDFSLLVKKVLVLLVVKQLSVKFILDEDSIWG